MNCKCFICQEQCVMTESTDIICCLCYEKIKSQLTATEAKLTKAKVFEKIIRDMYPKYMSIVDGAVEVSLKALDKQS